MERRAQPGEQTPRAGVLHPAAIGDVLVTNDDDQPRARAYRRHDLRFGVAQPARLVPEFDVALRSEQFRMIPAGKTMDRLPRRYGDVVAQGRSQVVGDGEEERAAATCQAE